MPSHDSQSKQQPDRSSKVTDLVSRALDTIRERRTPGNTDDAWIARLRDAVVSPDAHDRDEVIQRMRDAGIGIEQICDVYIPAVARELGEEWCADEISFADVTIGSARLQALLRDTEYCAETPDDGVGWGAMILVLADPHHTLGAMVLTGQLRRVGASVRLMLGRPEEEVLRIAREVSFDGIFISVALADDFSNVAETVSALRRATGGAVPLIVGGSVVEIGRDMALRLTGADLATSDPREALGYCGYDDRADQT